MKIGLEFRNELSGIPGGFWIVQQFDKILAGISGVWGREHLDNGAHGDITADAVTSLGAITRSESEAFADVVVAAHDDGLSNRAAMSSALGTGGIALVVGANAHVEATGPGAGAVTQYDTSQVGWYAITDPRSGNDRYRIQRIDTAGVTRGILYLDANSTADETTLLLPVAGGTPIRVSVGAADSGGAGFRLLRVPN